MQQRAVTRPTMQTQEIKACHMPGPLHVSRCPCIRPGTGPSPACLPAVPCTPMLSACTIINLHVRAANHEAQGVTLHCAAHAISATQQMTAVIDYSVCMGMLCGYVAISLMASPVFTLILD